jgi:hypothetical protein
MVASLHRWIKAGDLEAPLEYEGQVVSNKAVVSLTLRRVLIKGQPALNSAIVSSEISTRTQQSVKRKREHKGWQQEAWEVRYCILRIT